MTVKVKNLKGTSDRDLRCGCSSWLDHWKNNKHIYIVDKCFCCNNTKDTQDLVGGHVIKIDSYDRDQYIVPICKGCNNKTDVEFYVDENSLVSANCDNCVNK